VRTAMEVDIEDLPLGMMARPSPFEQFRRKGFLSVSDLVGTIWCEVQVSLLLPFLSRYGRRRQADRTVRLVSPCRRLCHRLTL
jgi:hypothetical protein